MLMMIIQVLQQLERCLILEGIQVWLQCITAIQISFYPMLFISVKNNLRVREVLKHAKDVFYERQKTISTSDLNI